MPNPDFEQKMGLCKLAGPLRLTATPKGRISEWIVIHLLSGIYGSEAPALQSGGGLDRFFK